MVSFVVGVIFLIIAVLLFIFFKSVSFEQGYSEPRKVVSTRWVSSIPAVLGVIFIVLSFFAVVGTRNVGVPTVFGKPTGDNYHNGLNFKAPWVNVTDIDATIHPVEYFGDKCIEVKIADGGEACVSLAYRWSINPDEASKVFADYRNSDASIDDAVRHALVSTNIKAAINEVLGEYDPLENTGLSPNMTPEQLASVKVNVVPDYEKYNAEIRTNVEQKIKDTGDLVNIQSVTISNVKLPKATQSRINAYNQAVQNTKIALQDVATKTAQAAGNEKLAASLQDPNVLVSECFDSLSSGDFNPPAGFSCWPGGGNSVVVPAAK